MMARVGGTDSIDNLTVLCKKCHNYVELELIKKENVRRISQNKKRKSFG